MSNSKISALTASTTPLAGTEVLPIVQSSATKQVSVANLTAGRSVSVATLLATGGYSTVTITSTTGGTKTINIGSDAFTNAFIGTTTAHNLSLVSNAAIVAEVTTAGNFSVNTGNVVIGTSGKGIDFSATPGTGTSELLSDYEEGTWTPTIASGSGAITSYTTTNCTYTKVGRLVTLLGSFTITNNGTGAGNIQISSLPFSVVNTSSAGGMARETANTGNMCSISIDGSTSTLVMRFYENSYPGGTGNSFKFMVTYIV